MIRMVGKGKITRYFEIPSMDRWDALDYFIFVLEASYASIVPFIGGVLLVGRGQLRWFFLLVIPIYLKLKIERKKQNKRKIFVG